MVKINKTILSIVGLGFILLGLILLGANSTEKKWFSSLIYSPP